MELEVNCACAGFVPVLQQTGTNQAGKAQRKGPALLVLVVGSWLESRLNLPLKTAVRGTVPGVRIPLPPYLNDK